MAIFHKKKKIFFVYFSFTRMYYSPVDIGYILALMKQKGLMHKYDFEFIQSHINFDDTGAKIREGVSSLVNKMKPSGPAAVFFFLDNIMWAKIFALKRAQKIAQKIRMECPQAHIGVQSYKFGKDQLEEASSCNLFDSLIGDDPENSFMFIDDILERKTVPGVIYPDEINDPERFIHFSKPCSEIREDTLDHIPSPYLSHIFDSYLKEKQRRLGERFVVHLYSSRGCRFGCYYCARSVKFEKVSLFSAKRFYDEIEYAHNHFDFIRFFVIDDAFLYSRHRLKMFLKEFEDRKKKNKSLEKIQLFVMARIESLDEEVIILLTKLNVVWIQIGLQTIKPDLQKYMNRKVPIEKFITISNLLKKYKIKLFLDIIVGLPNDSIGYFKKTIDFAIALESEAMQVKQLYFNPGTLFYLKQKEYGIEIENIRNDFNLPDVRRATGIDDKYHKEAYGYVNQIIKKHPKAYWRVITRLGACSIRNRTFNDFFI